jgi:hypothetical protein
MSIGEDREQELCSIGFDAAEVFSAAKMRQLANTHGQVIFTSTATDTTYSFRVEEARDGDVYFVTLVKLAGMALTGAQQRKLTIRGRNGKGRADPGWA